MIRTISGTYSGGDRTYSGFRYVNVPTDDPGVADRVARLYAERLMSWSDVHVAAAPSGTVPGQLINVDSPQRLVDLLAIWNEATA